MGLVKFLFLWGRCVEPVEYPSSGSDEVVPYDQFFLNIYISVHA